MDLPAAIDLPDIIDENFIDRKDRRRRESDDEEEEEFIAEVRAGGRGRLAILEKLDEEDFVAKLAYLVDVFEMMNTANRSLQGHDLHICDAFDNVKALRSEIEFLIEEISVNRFESLGNFHSCSSEELKLANKQLIIDHLGQLVESIDSYFPDLNTELVLFIRDPFAHELNSENANIMAVCRRMKSSTAAMAKFKSLDQNFELYWTWALNDYRDLATFILRHLLVIPTTYRCEQAFSALKFIKTPWRNRLEVEAPLIVAVSKQVPQFEKLTQQ